MKKISDLLRMLKLKFKRGQSKTEPVTETDASAAVTEGEADEPAAENIADAPPAKRTCKPKSLKKIIVSAAILVLAVSGFAVLKLVFSAPEPQDEAADQEIYTHTAADAALLQAVRNNDAEEVSRCLSAGSSADAPDAYGMTAFKAAVALNRVEIVRKFVEAGQGAGNGLSIMVYAVVHDRPQVVKELMKLPLDVNMPDKNGYTPLLYAINRNHVNVARELLNSGADANAQGRDGVTPLIAAVTVGRPDMVAEILKAGANISVPSPSGETPMSIARRRNGQIIVALLADAENKVRLN